MQKGGGMYQPSLRGKWQEAPFPGLEGASNKMVAATTPNNLQKSFAKIAEKFRRSSKFYRNCVLTKLAAATFNR